MRIALAQMKNEGTIEKNLKKSISLIKEAAENNTDLILFPEVQLTEFFPQYEKKDVSQYRLQIDSDEVKAFQTVCKEACIMAVPNIYLEEGGNALVKADDKEQIFYVDIDLCESNKIREQKPYTNLRRVELYK